MAFDLDIERTIHQGTRPAPLVDDLFTTRADRALRRLEEVLNGHNCPQPISDAQRAFLKLLKRHQGKHHAIPQMQICTQLKFEARQLRGIVQDLRVVFGVHVGSSRDADNGGFYLITTDEEGEESTAGLYHQAVSMLRTVLAMRGGSDEERSKLLKSIDRAFIEGAK